MWNNLNQFVGEAFLYFDLADATVNRITLINIIDILIVTYFLYKVILWIKETRAWSLFKGIVLVLSISSLSFLFGLTTISWIVRGAVQTGILAMIIIFQPELRKALEELGKGHLNMPFGVGNDLSKAMSTNTLDEIVKAAYAMSKVKMGALIVVEKDVKLGDLEQTGIIIDASVSASLLLNIFEDKTPLHDGAVIIRNNRIAAASCILPLTASEIGKELGTRHRAAVGASEVSDAFAIAVSEESGKVSVANGGKLYKDISPEELRDRLGAGSPENEIEKEPRRFPFRKGRK
ncbi:MAG: diadenylate cyclase CdaA [Defluviitaleaceae bacterium]|nr:diadenylate cyclase CdaA [Defluviitaleaceae bacterium]